MARKILMVDDEPALVFATRLCLEGVGYEVATACDGSEALEKVLEVRPDLILLDVHMPVKNGWDVLETLKADPDTRGIPVIMLTVAAEPEDITRAYHHHCTWYHTKPFDPRDLIATIDRVLQA